MHKFNVKESAALLEETGRSCTTFIAGRQVTADGSRIFGRTDDSHGLVAAIMVPVSAVHRAAPWVLTDAKTGFKGEMPAEGCSYLSVPKADNKPGTGTWEEAVVNEYHVCLSATESIYANDQALAADPYLESGIDESILPAVVIPYVRTALEGVERLGRLIDRYGSKEGNAVVFADDAETWYMEIYTGHQWAAIRFPEDRYAIIANDGMLDTIDVEDKDGVRVSQDLVRLAREHHFLQEEGGRIHVAHTYGRYHRHYSQLRVWAGQRMFSPSQAKAYDVDHTYDLLMVPDHKIALAEVMELFRYRYEDLGYNVNLHSNNRAIGINRTVEAHLFWLRDHKPQVMWVALANPEMSVFLPYYGNVTRLPAAFSLGGESYNPASAYYKFRSLSALAVQDRAGYGKKVRDFWRQMELGLIEGLPALDSQYLAAGQSSEAANLLCGAAAQRAMDAADTLFKETLTSFMLATVQDGVGLDATAVASADM
jgi:dipeptidase